MLTGNQVDDLTQSLSARVGEVGQHNTAGDATIRKLVNTLLSSDDKLLASLQKLGWELETEDDEEQRDVALLRETCARWVAPDLVLKLSICLTLTPL